jgi:hypothetical protein
MYGLERVETGLNMRREDAVVLTFVCAFLQLAVMRGLLDNSEDLLRESLVGDRPGGGWIVGHVGSCTEYRSGLLGRRYSGGRCGVDSRDPCVGSPCAFMCELFVVVTSCRLLSRSWRKKTQARPSAKPQNGAKRSSLSTASIERSNTSLISRPSSFTSSRLLRIDPLQSHYIYTLLYPPLPTRN